MALVSDPIEVLLVEDNPADVRLTRMALQGGRLEKHLSIAEDGEAANCFVTKPIGLHPFLQAVRKIEDFWIRTATLPPETVPERRSGG
jgi:hypothetical protein